MYERNFVLKTKLIVILLGAVIAVPNQSFSQKLQPGQNANSLPAIATLEGRAESEAVANVLATPSALPRGPQDMLQDYEAGMASVTQQFSVKVAAIAEAAQRGELSSEQANGMAAEQYQLAQMQFDLLSALHETLEQDIARATTTSQSVPETKEQNVVALALPFSSLQLSPALIEYLSLSSYQVSSIEKIMSDERRNLAPLMTQMQTTQERLVRVADHSETKDKKEVQVLAADQARNLTQLIVANSRMRTKIYQLLSPQQQKKLDEFQPN